MGKNVLQSKFSTNLYVQNKTKLIRLTQYNPDLPNMFLKKERKNKFKFKIMRAVVAQLNKQFAEIQNILLKLFKILHIAHGSMQRNFQKSENVTFSFQLLQEVEIVVFQVKLLLIFPITNQTFNKF